jgi:hypothetical protein
MLTFLNCFLNSYTPNSFSKKKIKSRIKKIEPKQWTSILELSQKYKVQELVKISKFKISLSLQVEDFFNFQNEFFLGKHLDIKDELVQFAVENFTLLVQHSNFHTIEKDLLVNILREKFLLDLKIPNESSKLLVKNIQRSFQNSCWPSSGNDEKEEEEEEEEEEESTPLSGNDKKIFNESLKRHAEKIKGSDEENEEGEQENQKVGSHEEEEISKVESEEENLESEEFSEDE